MKRISGALAGLTLVLAGCNTVASSPVNEAGHIRELPPRVLEIAAPGQDLTMVRLNPADGCYQYRYAGPVEVTYLPLRAKGGRPICTRAA